MTTFRFDSIKLRRYGYIVCLFAFITYLLFKGLDNNCFWDDEAITAIIAKNLLKTGKLSGWDGRNLLTFRQGTLLYDNYDVREPPLQCIVAAISFKLLGVSTWAARFPFVVCGLLSLIILWVVLRDTLEGYGWARYYAFVLVAFSYSFLLSCRQCRYYSLSLFFILLSYFFYRRIVERGNLINFGGFFAAITLFYYTHFLLAASFIVSLVVVHLIFYRTKFTIKKWILGIILSVLWILANLPYSIKRQIWYRPDIGEASWVSKPIGLFWNLRGIDFTGYFPFVAGVVLLYIILRFRKKENFIPLVAYEWLTIVGCMLILISIFSPQPITWKGLEGGLADIRYLFPLLPFCAGCLGVLLWILHRGYGFVFAFVVCVLMLCTNVLSLNLGVRQFRLTLPGYIYEIHNDYATPYDTTVAYLKSRASEDEIVFAIPEYTVSVFHFYLGDKLRIGSKLRKQTKLSVEKLRLSGYPVFIDDYFPHWIVSFAMNPERENMIAFFSRDKYSYVLDKTIEIFWEDRTRPELPWHSFKPTQVVPNSGEGIYVFRRIEKINKL